MQSLTKSRWINPLALRIYIDVAIKEYNLDPFDLEKIVDILKDKFNVHINQYQAYQILQDYIISIEEEDSKLIYQNVL